jgi:hypothetical protein
MHFALRLQLKTMFAFLEHAQGSERKRKRKYGKSSSDTGSGQISWNI